MRCVVVTGAESGIGAACAAAFGGCGDRVAVLYFNDAQAAQASVAAVEQAGGQGIAVQCNVGDEASVAAAFDTVERQWGPASVLVNSAGLNMTGVKVRDMPLAQWQRLLDTDLTGAFLTSRRFLTSRAADVPASIVHISSIHAYAVRAGGADYCAAKGGLSNLVETLAIEEAANGVRVNAVEPGMILTPMNARAESDAAYRKTLTDNIPMGRAGDATEVAALVRWLSSSEASYITGARIAIDGGLSLMQALGA
ncbi:MAG: SDR family oxidoreductase [Sphingomonas sp.]|uniref:SDR family oxidoreductase n=1 Tax=Sphingomonas sp. TaxID=28214 RepID=UPI001AD25F01|nr:SDR family oxidoreductase [Sphingomonas sp.]MBN8808037.1 SDR family oxidoreductase [Sphingomonas sp.]